MASEEEIKKRLQQRMQAQMMGKYLAQLFQSGQLKERITDEQLVIILRKLTEKRETKIRRK